MSMRVYIRFVEFVPTLNNDSAAVITQVFGAYTSASLVVYEREGHVCSFGTSLFGGVFDESLFAGTFPYGDQGPPVETGCVFLKLNTTDEEADKIMRTCRGCVRAKKLFNLRDWVLYNIPFREPIECTLFETRTLNDTQSVILILRECLSSENRICKVLQGLHSRTTMASALYETLMPYFRLAAYPTEQG